MHILYSGNTRDNAVIFSDILIIFPKTEKRNRVMYLLKVTINCNNKLAIAYEIFTEFQNLYRTNLINKCNLLAVIVNDRCRQFIKR